LALALRFVEDQCRRDGDIQRLSHAVHRNDDVLVDALTGVRTDPMFFRSQHDHRRLGVVRPPEVHGRIGEVSGIEAKSLTLECFQAGRRIIMTLQLDPALGAARGMVELR